MVCYLEKLRENTLNNFQDLSAEQTVKYQIKIFQLWSCLVFVATICVILMLFYLTLNISAKSFTNYVDDSHHSEAVIGVVETKVAYYMESPLHQYDAQQATAQAFYDAYSEQQSQASYETIAQWSFLVLLVSLIIWFIVYKRLEKSLKRAILEHRQNSDSVDSKKS